MNYRVGVRGDLINGLLLILVGLGEKGGGI